MADHPSFTITGPHDFRLADHDPSLKPKIDKLAAQARTAAAVGSIAERQAMMMAADHWAVLVVFQGMDASGKDGTIDRVFSGVNPAGVIVTSFKAPSSIERAHDFLWRIHQAVPPSGRLGVFNRSHYEDVLVPRIHADQIRLQHLPPELATGEIWKHRLEDIANFERMLTRQGVVVIKFLLNISREEQRARLLSRLDVPDKMWKFEPTDLSERGHWDRYMMAYEEAIRATATLHAPWHIIPADRKWFARMTVAEIVADRLEQLDLRLPQPDAQMRRAFGKARTALEKD